MPRKTKRTPALVQEVLERLASGEPLASICRDEKMPSTQVWRDWCHVDETLAFAYARAREDGEDSLIAEALRIIDEEPATFSTEHGTRIDPGDVANRKMRFEGRLKLLAKWNPKRWGEKLDVGLTVDQSAVEALKAARKASK